MCDAKRKLYNEKFESLKQLITSAYDL